MFYIDYCDYNIHNADYDTIYRPNGCNSHLFLLILAPMRFYFDKKEVIAKPGACLLYTPNYSQHYQGIKEFYNSYVHFKCDIHSLEHYSFPVNELFYPKNKEDINYLLKKIHLEYLTKQIHYEATCNSLITQLLIACDRNCLEKQQVLPYHSELFTVFQTLRLQLLDNCQKEWTVKQMCQIVNLEKSQLYSYYKKFYRNTPKGELILARIDKAKNLLTNEAIQVSQVALLCGFSNIYHFSRYFKKICGCTPSEYAKRNHSLLALTIDDR